MSPPNVQNFKAGLEENITQGGADTEDENPDLNTPFLGGTDLSNPPQFPFPITSSSEPSKNPFQFQQRARETSPQHQVSSRIAANRADRKSNFISRLRQTRRNSRDNRIVDSFEKAEYWREEQEREQRLMAEAQRLGIDVDLDLEEFMVEEERAGQPSPISEEREVEELVDAYFEGQNQPSQTHGHEVDEFMDDSFEDGPAYEEVFAAILSQEETTVVGNTFNPVFGARHARPDHQPVEDSQHMDVSQ